MFFIMDGKDISLRVGIMKGGGESGGKPSSSVYRHLHFLPDYGKSILSGGGAILGRYWMNEFDGKVYSWKWDILQKNLFVEEFDLPYDLFCLD